MANAGNVNVVYLSVSNEPAIKRFIEMLENREPGIVWKFKKLKPQDLKSFKPKLEHGVFVLLHSVWQGRNSITDVHDAIYHTLLKQLKEKYGPDRIAVVVHSMPNFSSVTSSALMRVFKKNQPTTFLCSDCVIQCKNLCEMPEEDFDKLLKFINKTNPKQAGNIRTDNLPKPMVSRSNLNPASFHFSTVPTDDSDVISGQNPTLVGHFQFLGQEGGGSNQLHTGHRLPVSVSDSEHSGTARSEGAASIQTDVPPKMIEDTDQHTLSGSELQTSETTNPENAGSNRMQDSHTPHAEPPIPMHISNNADNDLEQPRETKGNQNPSHTQPTTSIRDAGPSQMPDSGKPVPNVDHPKISGTQQSRSQEEKGIVPNNSASGGDSRARQYTQAETAESGKMKYIHTPLESRETAQPSTTSQASSSKYGGYSSTSDSNKPAIFGGNLNSSLTPGSVSTRKGNKQSERSEGLLSIPTNTFNKAGNSSVQTRVTKSNQKPSETQPTTSQKAAAPTDDSDLISGQNPTLDGHFQFLGQEVAGSNQLHTRHRLPVSVSDSEHSGTARSEGTASIQTDVSPKMIEDTDQHTLSGSELQTSETTNPESAESNQTQDSHTPHAQLPIPMHISNNADNDLEQPRETKGNQKPSQTQPTTSLRDAGPSLMQDSGKPVPNLDHPKISGMQQSTRQEDKGIVPNNSVSGGDSRARQYTQAEIAESGKMEDFHTPLKSGITAQPSTTCQASSSKDGGYNSTSNANKPTISGGNFKPFKTPGSVATWKGTKQSERSEELSSIQKNISNNANNGSEKPRVTESGPNPGAVSCQMQNFHKPSEVGCGKRSSGTQDNPNVTRLRQLYDQPTAPVPPQPKKTQKTKSNRKNNVSRSELEPSKTKQYTKAEGAKSCQMQDCQRRFDSGIDAQRSATDQSLNLKGVGSTDKLSKPNASGHSKPQRTKISIKKTFKSIKK